MNKQYSEKVPPTIALSFVKVYTLMIRIYYLLYPPETMLVTQGSSLTGSNKDLY